MDRKGRQEPTRRACEPYAETLGPAAVRLAAYGLTPHPWQEAVLNDWLAVDERGRYVHTTCILDVPRQNGKTGVSDPRETFGLLFRGEKILHTAQEFQTAQKAFDRLRKKFGSRVNDPYAEYPELNAMVERYTTSANQMVLDLKNGGHIEFRTRGSGGDMGRGGTFDLVVIDEAQSYTDEQDAALSPLNSAAPSGSPQTILMGTVPDPRIASKGDKFRRLRDQALGPARPKGFCIHEWSVTEIGDVNDVDRWYEANPSLGYQLLLSALEKDAASMLPGTFAREHLGWWSATAGKPTACIDREKWAACAVDGSDEPTDTAYGVKFAPDGSDVVLAVAERRPDGRVHVELLERAPMTKGTAWLASWLLQRSGTGRCAVIDGRSGAPALFDRMASAPKGYAVAPRTGDVTAAASMLVDAVNGGTLTWFSAQQQLDESAKSATRRRIGADGGWGFGGADPIPIEACSLALWGLETSKRDPKRKMRIG